MDLIEALEAGHLAHATLDVFREEPLPEWAAPQIVENIHRALSGRPLLNPVDPQAGY